MMILFGVSGLLMGYAVLYFIDGVSMRSIDVQINKIRFFHNFKSNRDYLDFYKFLYSKKNIYLIQPRELGVIAICITIVVIVYLCKGAQASHYLPLYFVLMTSALIDLKSRIIPNKIILTGICFFATLSMAQGGVNSVLISCYGFLAGALPLFGMALITKEGIGMGDVKLMGVVGGFLGAYSAICGLILAILASGIFVGIMLAAGKLSRKSSIPFAPFIFIGSFIVSLL